VFHILDIPRSRLASDTENAEDWRGFTQAVRENDGTISVGNDLHLLLLPSFSSYFTNQ
jgi:hypothetical protein